MPLNSSGPISLAGTTVGESIEKELGGSGTTQISLNDSNVRSLAGVASGQITMPTNFWGKGSGFSATISTNQTNLNLRTWALANGWNGTSPATITIGTGVYIYSTAVGTPGLTINGTWPGGISLINNGYILGQGGNGGNPNPTTTNPVAGNAGGNAISLGINCTITNNTYIAGGGGGGAAGYSGGGGGAGGGVGGVANYNGSAAGGTGGAVGASGGNGGFVNNFTSTGAGGGGGRILPGTGGAAGPTTTTNCGGFGGGAGGGGGAGYWDYYGQPFNGGAGGSSNSAGTNATLNGGYGGGGGGGWGASGGSSLAGGATAASGGAGGKAVALNGFTVTWLANGARYGAIS